VVHSVQDLDGNLVAVSCRKDCCMRSVAAVSFVGLVAGVESRDLEVVLHSIQYFHGNLAAMLSYWKYCCMLSVVVVHSVGLAAGVELREIVGVDGRVVGCSTGSSFSLGGARIWGTTRAISLSTAPACHFPTRRSIACPNSESALRLRMVPS